MQEISTRALMIAIGCMVADRERLLRRIDTETAETDAEERLSEQVMDIDRSLGELADAYQNQRHESGGFPPYEDLVRGITGEP